MSKPEFFVTPGYGDRNVELFHYSQAVKIGDRVEISGQGGWNDDWEFPESLADEIAQAFRNIERTLALAGASWEHVIHVNSYHVPAEDGGIQEQVEAMVELFRKYLPGQPPIWTCIGVPVLGDPKMRVEVRVTAVIAD
jgi:enamine deaminase RidA (YjgF/YER057c/UK114 family)